MTRAELQNDRWARLRKILAHYRTRPRYSDARMHAVAMLRDWQENDGITRRRRVTP